MRRCIVSCSYSPDGRYHKYGRRLEESLQKHGYNGGLKIWTDSFPPNAPPHQQMHYAFKYHAVKWAVDQGFDQVMWLDAAAYAVANIEPVWNEIEKRGVYIVAGTEPLGEWISDQALAHFKTTRDDAMKLYLCGGAIVGLWTRRLVAQSFLGIWENLAASGLFISAHSKYAPDKMKSLWVQDGNDNLVISEDPRVKGHRSDEACFSLVLRDLGIEPGNVYDWNNYIRTGYNL